MRTIVRKVRNELKSETRIEKNIVVSGIPEVNGDEGDEVAIKELLTALSVNTTRSVIKRKRLHKKNPVEAVQSPSPPHILIEFADRETQELALKNARNLRSLAKFDKVYINRDKTDAVRKEEAKLRREGNERNKELPFVEGDRRYGVDENNKRYYWGVRDGRLVQLEPRTEPTDK
jgi:hypothetical protein